MRAAIGIKCCKEMNQNKSNEVQIAGPLTGTVHWWECEIKDNRNDMIILDEEVHKWMLDV